MTAALFERVRAGSRRFLLAALVAIGAVCGLAAFVFHELIGVESSSRSTDPAASPGSSAPTTC